MKFSTGFGSTIGYLWDICGLSEAVVLWINMLLLAVWRNLIICSDRDIDSKDNSCQFNRQLMTILELFFVCPNECSTLHWWTKQKLYRQFGGVLCGHASIIMLQKVAAMVDKVAADLCFRICKVRWILIKIFFALAASSAAIFLCTSIYYSNAVFSAFW